MKAVLEIYATLTLGFCWGVVIYVAIFFIRELW